MSRAQDNAGRSIPAEQWEAADASFSGSGRGREPEDVVRARDLLLSSARGSRWAAKNERANDETRGRAQSRRRRRLFQVAAAVIMGQTIVGRQMLADEGHYDKRPAKRRIFLGGGVGVGVASARSGSGSQFRKSRL